MNIKPALRKVVMYYFLVIFFGACSAAPQMTTSAAANQFVNAINKSDAKLLLKLSGLPLHVYDQSWDSAKDGHGFVLGKHVRTILDNNEKLSTYINILVKKVKLESVEGEFIPIEAYSRFKEEFGPYLAEWKSRDVFVFLRGMADVEHLVIVGVNRKTKKIEQLYYN